MAQKLLELRNLNKSFGGLTVISDLDLHVNEDEIVSVIGPNGAGKTTLFNLITGVYRPDDGEILLDGESIVGLEPHQVTNRGVARTFQTLRLFLNMSVRENVMAVQYGRTKVAVLQSMFRLPRARREEREIHRTCGGEIEVLRRPADRLPLGSACVQPFVRKPAAARDRPRDGDRGARAAARRARRRDEPVARRTRSPS